MQARCRLIVHVMMLAPIVHVCIPYSLWLHYLPESNNIRCLQGQPASASGLEEIDSELLLGTLDLYAVRAMPGEVLIGEKLWA